MANANGTTWPSHVYALDIETTETSFKHPERCRLALAGVKPYTLFKGRYRAGRHRIFLSHQTRELRTFLERCPGIILGYNILCFDLPVLSCLFPVDDIIERAVDLYLITSRLREFEVNSAARSLLWRWSPIKGELGLDNLGKLNLGLPKLIQGRKIAAAWKRGQREKVIRYNERDCIVTFGLWQRLIRDGCLLYREGKRPLYQAHFLRDQSEASRLRRIEFKGRADELKKRYLLALCYTEQEDYSLDLRLGRYEAYLLGKKPSMSLQTWHGLKPQF